MSGTLKSVASLVHPQNIEKHRTRLSRYSWLVDVLRYDGSIIGRIIGPVLTVTIFATGVAVYSIEYSHPINLTNSVVPLLSVVVGLILVFRNGTSYDRYYEGRKDFGVMNSNIRNLSRLIWVNVNLPPKPGDKAQRTKGKEASAASTTTLSGLDLKADKVRALKLAISYAYAVKHHLRGEPGTDYEDYLGILPADFAEYNQTGVDRTYPNMNGSYSSAAFSSPETEQPPTPHHRIHLRKSQATLSDENTPLISGTNHRTVEFHPYTEQRSLPLPLIIAHEITRLIYKFKRIGALDNVGPAGANALLTLVQSMVDQLTAMERVSNTPIPASYGIHLKQCVTAFLFYLPFTLVHDLHYFMIPIVTVVAFTLMGIEGIANEIEMPFGTDGGDLPVDKYCADIRNEIEFIIQRLPEGNESDDPFAE